MTPETTRHLLEIEKDLRAISKEAANSISEFADNGMKDYLPLVKGLHILATWTRRNSKALGNIRRDAIRQKKS